MYTILVNNSNELIVTVKERIMQRSKLVDNLHFLVEPKYKEYDMSGFTVTMEYILPVSREYKTETLVLSSSLYKEKLEYKLPFDTAFTKEAGKIEGQLTFTKAEMDTEGNVKQMVRKTSPCTITIIPIAEWSNIVPDAALSALDQRLIQLDLLTGQLMDFEQHLYETKADNIIYNEVDSTIQLVANGVPIGNKITISVNDIVGSGVGIKSVEINANGELIVIFTDETQTNCGRVVGRDGKVYVPHLDERKILTFSIEENPTEIPPAVDLNPHDEWSNLPEDGVETNYVWEFI
jgi:hypothetical protein